MGEIVCVGVAVAVFVAVGGSDVAVVVGNVASVDVGVIVGVSCGGVFLGVKIKANIRINPMMAGIPYLMYGRDASVDFLYGVTTGGLPV